VASNNHCVIDCNLALVLLTALLLFFGLPDVAFSAPNHWQTTPIDCAGLHSKGQIDSQPEALICNSVELRRLDIDLGKVYRRVAKHCFGDKRQVFLEQQRSWIIDRNLCTGRLMIDAMGRPQLSGVYECVKASMVSRMQLLKTLSNMPDGFERHIADFDYITPWYVNRFAYNYSGRTVSVVGSLQPSDCHRKNATSGILQYEGTSITVHFARALSDPEINFLCRERPFSWWNGAVSSIDGREIFVTTYPLE
jgi:uncharacterized protein YecT (DUF1311 family)